MSMGTAGSDPSRVNARPRRGRSVGRVGYVGIALGAWAGLAGSVLMAPAVLAQSENVLIIVADDMGVDILKCYGEGSKFPPTPTIDGLRESGMLFRNAWSNPICSPTRATVQTGRYGFRTGVGGTVGQDSPNGLPLSETIVPELLDLNPTLGYSHAAIGKWHLTSEDQGGYDAPNLYGYSHYSGSIWQLEDYFDWSKTEDGETFQTTTYTTTDNANEALEWINDQEENPWFMWLAFNAPHRPFHAPPDELHSYDLSGSPPDWLLYRAMVEAMDMEMSRLFASMSPEVLEKTNVIFLGDNGTPASAILAPFDPVRGKGTLYEGGVNVPLIISGPRVALPGTESDALVSTVDLFATALEMMGVDVEATLPPETALDAVSLLPVLKEPTIEPREFVYSELFNYLSPQDTHGQTIRNVAGYKLIRFTVLETEEFYDLVLDPFEDSNLLLGELDPIQQANYDELTMAIDSLINDVCEGDVNGDGTVDPLDVGYVLSRFGDCK